MRKLIFSIATILCVTACNYNRVEIIPPAPEEAGITKGIPWEEMVFLVTIPQFDYTVNEETTEVSPGLRLDNEFVLTKMVYLHEPREDELMTKSLDGKETSKTVVQEKYFAELFSILKMTTPLPGSPPVFSERLPRLGENVRVGPYPARIYAARLYGERFRRYEVVFRREAFENAYIPYDCSTALPITDDKDMVLGVMLEDSGSADTFPPVGFAHARCEFMTTKELFNTLAVFGITP